ncbi:hypothetical protein EIP91_005497 [Steccherinum ochraceum]|uniref:NADP-dependent oxidoreductase domain-containing protein n=1 Tax=Steccherinum ochraceum TaxID=92696 RepID=A0A4R0RS99_9APHY|nr:hypothetical protein EIP91_005497 [Steccherinum ochraceum]
MYPQISVQEFCKAKGILVTAYSPFGAGMKELIDHPTLKDIGSRIDYSPTQVIMGWLLKKGLAVIPKSATVNRMLQNLKYADISAEDEAQIDGIHKAPGMHRMSWGHLCVDGNIFGWWYEQLGWPLRDGGFQVRSKSANFVLDHTLLNKYPGVNMDAARRGRRSLISKLETYLVSCAGITFEDLSAIWSALMFVGPYLTPLYLWARALFSLTRVAEDLVQDQPNIVAIDNRTIDTDSFVPEDDFPHVPPAPSLPPQCSPRRPIVNSWDFADPKRTVYKLIKRYRSNESDDADSFHWFEDIGSSRFLARPPQLPSNQISPGDVYMYRPSRNASRDAVVMWVRSGADRWLQATTGRKHPGKPGYFLALLSNMEPAWVQKVDVAEGSGDGSGVARGLLSFQYASA